MQVFDPNKNIFRYIVGVALIIAAVGASSYFTLQAIQAGKEWAGIINMSGRQRMLSQRIQLLAERVSDGAVNEYATAELERRLEDAVALFAKSHRELSEGGELGYANLLTPEIQALYFDPNAYAGLPYAGEGDRSLDDRVKALIADAEIALMSTGMDLARSDTLSGLDRLTLLRQLNHVVGAFEREAERAILEAERVALLCLVAILLIILAQVLLSFLPAHRWTVNAIARLTDLADEAACAQREAESALKAKSTFLSNMSHEIRTPLNGIIGSLQVFSDNSLSSSSRNLIDAITQSSKTLLAIVNDILDVSKLEAGALRLHPGPTRLVDILTSSAVLMRPMAQKKRLTLDFDHNLDPNLVVSIDQTRLAQVINNLLSNAVKFTSEGGVTMSACLITEDDDHCELEVRVKDTGCGIAEDKQEDVFERFVQVKGEVRPEQRGTGLGLSISREIIDLMDGNLFLESVEGEGSTFGFCVALQKLKNLSEDKVNPETVSPLNVLLVEDIPLNRELARRMLCQMGHSVDMAEDGQDAVEQINERGDAGWDLLIVDNRMPRKSGLELIREVREMPGDIADAPIIVMSADVLDDERDAFMAAGASGFVPKPVDSTALEHEISRCCIAR